ncbi:hypothetical protein [Pseudomonas hormoni]
MASAKLQMLERQMLRREERIPAPDTSGGIGAAIEELIANEVSQRVGEAVKEKSNRHLDMLFKPPAPKYTDYRQIPPTPRAPKPPVSFRLYRDGANKLVWAESSDGHKFKVLRDAAGLMIGMEEMRDDELPVLPPMDIATPRK